MGAGKVPRGRGIGPSSAVEVASDPCSAPREVALDRVDGMDEQPESSTDHAAREAAAHEADAQATRLLIRIGLIAVGLLLVWIGVVLVGFLA